jgi:hypothetical protein
MKGYKIVNRKLSATVWPLLAAAILCAVAPAKASEKKPNAEKRPNIVFMLTDNLGYGELDVYGGGVLRGAPTPRIDKLASEGMRLLNFNVEAQAIPDLCRKWSVRIAEHTATLVCATNWGTAR